MDIINEVKTDAQMLYTKKDVVELLEQMREQTIKEASKWLNENADNYISQYCKCMEFGFVVMFERAMKGE